MYVRGRVRGNDDTAVILTAGDGANPVMARAGGEGRGRAAGTNGGCGGGVLGFVSAFRGALCGGKGLLARVYLTSKRSSSLLATVWRVRVHSTSYDFTIACTPLAMV